jgi:hypothetical protein
MVVLVFDEDLKEEAKDKPLDDVELSDLKEHRQRTADYADSVYFLRDTQRKSLKERSIPNSSLIFSLLLSRSESIN